MFFDPLYMVVMGVGMALALGAQFWVKSSFRRWSKVGMARGMTGRDVAEAILRANGISDVVVEPTGGFLTDHYHPGIKRLRLSQDNYYGASVAAAGIAAHEVGHAIQHAQGYKPMRFRQQLVPVANIGTNVGMIMVIAGAAIGAMGLAQVGVFVFAGFVLFTLVTLPVEFDASARAMRSLDAMGILSRQEMSGVRAVLTAAAATYVAAAVDAILKLLYFAMRAGLLGGRRD